MRLFSVVLLLALGTYSPLSLAVGATKIAVLDISKLIVTSAAGREAMQQVNKEPKFSQLTDKYKNFEATLKILQEKENTESLTWGEEQNEAHKKEVDETKLKMRELAMEIQRNQQSIYTHLLKIHNQAIGASVDAVSKAEGIDLVLDSKFAIKVTETADITPMVLPKFDAIYMELKKEYEAMKGKAAANPAKVKSPEKSKK